MNGLNDKQMMRLIAEAEAAKKNGKPVKEAFEKIAKETDRASGSIRNIYYAAVKRSETDEKYFNKYFAGVKPEVAKIIEFDKAEAKVILKKILSYATDGRSVRSSIAAITSDPRTALRYQNKYRSMLSRDRAVVEETISEIKREKGRCFDPYKRGEDEMMARLKREINGLYDRISDNLRKENYKLKEKIAELEKENARLISGRVNDSVAKEYFENINEKGKRRRVEYQK